MANENNKINELVSEDDDPTAELDVANLRKAVSADAEVEQESDAHTYGVDGDDEPSSRQQSIPELQQDLHQRTKTISRLQYDIEQLRAKWLGLETEISAREEIVDNLNREVDKLKGDVELRDKQLKNRNDEIKAFKAEIQDREEESRRQLQMRSEIEEQLAELRKAEAELRAAEAEQVRALEDTKRELEDVRSELQSAVEKIAALETDVEKRGQVHGLLEQQHTDISHELAALRVTEAEHVTALRVAEAERVTSLEKSARELKRVHGELDSAENRITSLHSEAAQRDDSLASLEEQRAKLTLQLQEHRETIAEKDTALDTAERDLESLSFDLETALNEGPPEIVLANITTSDAKEIQAQIARTDEYADTLLHKMQDLADSNSALSRERDQLSRSLRQMTARNNDLSEEISTANQSITEMRSSLEQQRTEMQDKTDQQKAEMQATIDDQKAEMQAAIGDQKAEMQATIDDQKAEMQATIDDQKTQMQATIDDQKTQMQATIDDQKTQMQATIDKQQAGHEQEMRTLRFELDEAQNTVAETADMNSQLASELMDTRGFKNDLESMLSQNDEQSQQRIEDLENQIKRLSRATEDFEQKLDTKSTAINVLLGELAKKSEQMDSIGEIEEVIQDIDHRMSGRFDDAHAKEAVAEPDATHAHSDRDRVTRVLVGSVDDQVLRFPLFKDRLTIGRTHENDIQIKTSYVSRRHAVVLTVGDETQVIDWGSKNGVFINSKRVKEHVLSNGDIVAVGNAEFRYEERQKRDS